MSQIIMLSPHFSLAELMVSESAARLGIDNTPPVDMVANLEQTALKLEAVRALLGNKSIIVTSGYRSPMLNKAIKGSEKSAHMKGLAADFISPKYGSPLDICKAIANSPLIFDQLIYEYGRWVHLGFSKFKARKQILTVDKYGTRTGLCAIRL